MLKEAFCLAVMHLTGAIYQGKTDGVTRAQMMEQIHSISDKKLQSRAELIVVTAYAGYTSVPAEDIAGLAYNTCETSHHPTYEIVVDPWIWSSRSIY